MGEKLVIYCDICAVEQTIESFKECPPGWVRYRLYKENQLREIEHAYYSVYACPSCVPDQDQKFGIKLWKRFFKKKE